MPKEATGEKLQCGTDGVYTKRVRLHGVRHTIKLPLRSEKEAEDRALIVAQLARRMTLAKTDAKLALDGLERIGAAPAGLTLRGACKHADDLVAGWRPASTAPTFAAVCEQWNNGNLARKYPDHVPVRKEDTTIKAAKATLRKHILPRLGDIPVDLITLDMCNAVAESIASVPRRDSRRQILTPMKTVLDLCVHPLGYMERSPLPEGWLPKKEGSRKLQWLYPAEDAQLMACTEVPLHWRILWGFYLRNGLRMNEALVMTLSQFDLGGKPTAQLFPHQTKTKKSRLWPVMDCAEALRRWVALCRADAKPGDRMFIGVDGQRINPKTTKLADLLREHLKLAGVARSELFDRSRDGSRNIVVHDLRASFVTVKLALGWTPAQVQLRTGHEGDGEFKKYKRHAETLAEIEAGDFAPLHEAIPELSSAVSLQHGVRRQAAPAQPIDQPLTSARAKRMESQQVAHSIVELQPPSEGREMTEKPIDSQRAQHSSPVTSAPAGHSLVSADALRLAALEAQLAVLQQLVVQQPAALVAQLTGELARQVTAAVVGELQQQGLAARPRPTLASSKKR